MQDKRIVVRDVDSLSPQLTSHGIGEKVVLLANGETPTNITQIAISHLSEGEEVETHAHATMDEHFFVLEGKGGICINNEYVELKAGRFVLVPATFPHSLKAVSDLKFITIGVATE